MIIRSLSIRLRSERKTITFAPLPDDRPGATRIGGGWVKNLTTWIPAQNLADLIIRYALEDKNVNPDEIRLISDNIGPVSVETRYGKRTLEQFFAMTSPWNDD